MSQGEDKQMASRLRLAILRGDAGLSPHPEERASRASRRMKAQPPKPGLHGSRGDAQASSAGALARLLTMRIDKENA
jgi:hypothetical protein